MCLQFCYLVVDNQVLYSIVFYCTATYELNLSIQVISKWNDEKCERKNFTKADTPTWTPFCACTIYLHVDTPARVQTKCHDWNVWILATCIHDMFVNHCETHCQWIQAALWVCDGGESKDCDSFHHTFWFLPLERYSLQLADGAKCIIVATHTERHYVQLAERLANQLNLARWQGKWHLTLLRVISYKYTMLIWLITLCTLCTVNVCEHMLYLGLLIEIHVFHVFPVNDQTWKCCVTIGWKLVCS